MLFYSHLRAYKHTKKETNSSGFSKNSFPYKIRVILNAKIIIMGCCLNPPQEDPYESVSTVYLEPLVLNFTQLYLHMNEHNDILR